MTININNKTIIRFLTFVPPILGILVFTYVVKFTSNNEVSERLPIYQGISAYFSLILIGFSYMKKRKGVIGYKFLFFLLIIFLIPIAFYLKVGFSSIFLITLITLTIFLSSISLFLFIIKNNKFLYLLLSCFNSIFLPFILILDLRLLSFFVFFYLLINIFVLKNLYVELENFKFTDSGLDFFKSILLQSPFLLLPFFDYKISELIGSQNYTNYVLYLKYINGAITVLFAYNQLELVFSGKLKHTLQIIIVLLIILTVSLTSTLLNSYLIFILLITLYSFGLNLSSLVVRKFLLTGLSLRLSIIGISFVLIYFILINILGSLIQTNNNIFISLMITCIILPTLLCYKLTNTNYSN